MDVIALIAFVDLLNKYVSSGNLLQDINNPKPNLENYVSTQGQSDICL